MNIMFTTNVTGLINMTQAILPIFQKRPDGGQGDIINIGSIAGMPSCPSLVSSGPLHVLFLRVISLLVVLTACVLIFDFLSLRL